MATNQRIKKGDEIPFVQIANNLSRGIEILSKYEKNISVIMGVSDRIIAEHQSEEMALVSATDEALLKSIYWFRRLPFLFSFRPPTENRGYVYVAQIGKSNTYKIGCSKDPKRRKRELERTLGANVEFIFTSEAYNMFDAERELHTLHESTRMSGEFFTLSSENIESIKRVNYGI